MSLVYLSGPDLLLSDVKRYGDGSLKSGTVKNGGWNFSVRNKWCYCGTEAMWPFKSEWREVVIPEDKDGHYNEVINWARTQL